MKTFLPFLPILALLASVCIAGAQTEPVEDEMFMFLFEKAGILTRVTKSWNEHCTPTPTDKDAASVCLDIKTKLEEQMANFIEDASTFQPTGEATDCEKEIHARVIKHFAQNFSWNLQFGGGRLLGKTAEEEKAAIALRIKIVIEQTNLQQDINDCLDSKEKAVKPQAKPTYQKISDPIP